MVFNVTMYGGEWRVSINDETWELGSVDECLSVMSTLCGFKDAHGRIHKKTFCDNRRERRHRLRWCEQTTRPDGVVVPDANTPTGEYYVTGTQINNLLSCLQNNDYHRAITLIKMIEEKQTTKPEKEYYMEATA